jgi:hypothetical protein
MYSPTGQLPLQQHPLPSGRLSRRIAAAAPTTNPISAPFRACVRTRQTSSRSNEESGRLTGALVESDRTIKESPSLRITVAIAGGPARSVVV